jgi:hypothetical protein
VLVAYLLIALQIRAAGDCPGAGEVEHELGRLLGDETVALDVATIAPAADGSVSLSLADTSGQPIGARTLPRARTCGEQAKAVAVTLAVWEAQLHPEISLGLDRLASDSARPSEKMAVVARAAPPLAPSSPPARELTLGAAALGDVQSGGWAPGARLELALGGVGARWRARVAVAGVGRHRIELPPGRVSWWRAFVQVGADVDLARGQRWAVVVGAGVLGGLVSVAGSGFPVDHATRSLDLGGEGRARLEARLGGRGHVRPWLGASVAMWARRQALDVRGTDTSSALPRVEPMAALGADLVW